VQWDRIAFRTEERTKFASDSENNLGDKTFQNTDEVKACHCFELHTKIWNVEPNINNVHLENIRVVL
jgi:hypothetical protein